MNDPTQKASVLIEAMPYIQRFRNEIVVIKFGGSAMENLDHAEGIAADVTFMECAGMQPVMVHGGGKAISRGMKDHGIASEFVKGLRVTCEKSIEVVKNVIKGEVQPRIVSLLEKRGARAMALHGEDIFRVKKKTEVDPGTGRTLDWGFVGEPEEVNTGPILDLLRQNIIPVIPPLGMGSDGKVHNINADTAAAAVATALRARKIVFLSDVPGLMRDPDNSEEIITTLKLDEVEPLIEKGIIAGGMLPKVQGGMTALRAGVKKAHMVDGRMPHSLLLEIFTDEGVGTEIVK